MGTTVTPTSRLLGKCPTCIRPIGLDDDGLADFIEVLCPECGIGATLERVYGTVSSSPCAGECMSALGAYCSCGCGGVNHGGLFVQTGTALASAVERFRQRTEVRKAAAVKRSVKAAEKRRRTAAEKAEQEAAERDAFMAEHADLWAFLTTHVAEAEAAGQWPDEFFGSLRGHWERKGLLTENQLVALTTAIRRSAERVERKAIEAANAKLAPLGTQTIEGVVLHVRDQEGYHGGTEWKMLVGCDGYKVWCTVPRGIWEALPYQQGLTLDMWLTGRAVRFTATLEPSRDGDPSFAVAKRPRAAMVREAVSA